VFRARTDSTRSGEECAVASEMPSRVVVDIYEYYIEKSDDREHVRSGPEPTTSMAFRARPRARDVQKPWVAVTCQRIFISTAHFGYFAVKPQQQRQAVSGNREADERAGWARIIQENKQKEDKIRAEMARRVEEGETDEVSK